MSCCDLIGQFTFTNIIEHQIYLQNNVSVIMNDNSDYYNSEVYIEFVMLAIELNYRGPIRW